MCVSVCVYILYTVKFDCTEISSRDQLQDKALCPEL